jgi:hypothetical protein
MATVGNEKYARADGSLTKLFAPNKQGTTLMRDFVETKKAAGSRTSVILNLSRVGCGEGDGALVKLVNVT